MPFHKISIPKKLGEITVFCAVYILITTCNKTLLNIMSYTSYVSARLLGLCLCRHFCLLPLQAHISICAPIVHDYVPAYLRTYKPTRFVSMCLCKQIVCIPTSLLYQMPTYTLVHMLEYFKNPLLITRDNNQ